MQNLPEHIREQFQDFRNALAEYYPEQLAKMAAARPMDEDVEKAFLDQAYSYIEPKAGVLMQDQYRLGFEVVWSNEGRTKILAIAAFRVGGDLLFAPVMFINSRVKVPGLLWNTRTRQMGHLDPEWSRWLVSKSKFSNAGPTTLDNVQQASLLNNIIGFRRGGGFTKWSSDGDDSEYADKLDEQDIEKNFSTPQDPEEVFSEIHRDPKDEEEENWEEFADFTYSSLARKQLSNAAKGLGQKVANAMLNSIDFAEAMYLTYGDPNEWLPGLMPKKAEVELRFIPLDQVKQAAAKLSVQDKAWLLKQGMYVQDNRNDAKVSCVMLDGEHSVETVNQPGIWSLVQADGSSKKCAVFKVSGEVEKFQSEVRGEDSFDRYPPEAWLVIQGGKYCMCDRPAAGKMDGMIDSNNIKGVTTPGSDLQAGHIYARVDANGVVTGFFSVAGKQKVGDGIVEYSIRPHSTYQLQDGSVTFGGRPRNVFYHPQKKNRSESTTFGPEDYFIKLPAKSLKKGEGGSEPFAGYTWTGEKDVLADSSSDAIDRWIFNRGLVKKVACHYQANTFSLSCERNKVEGINRKEATFHLMKSAHMRLWDAASLLDAAEERGSAEVTLCAPDDMVKAAAAMLPVWREPIWAEGRDNVTGVKENYDQGWAYPVEENFPVFPTSRYGDKFALGETAASGQSLAPEGSGIDWATVTPDELATLASKGETPSVFHHGVIAALAQEQDAKIDLDISKELPSHYKFIDSLGRLIFRFHWNPGSFERLYGSDDLSEIETQLNGAWSIVGKLVLSLQQRADSFNRRGSDRESSSGM